MPAKTVGSFVPALTKKAFEKFGFSTASLVTDWPRIAGAELASYTVPERLKWPRGGEANVAGDDDGERRGATLTLRVDPARALDVEYRGRQILDRLNAYFGYRAVETLRLVQAPLERTPSHPLPPGHKGRDGGNTEVGPVGEANGDPQLAAALARLERGLRREGGAPRGA